MLKILASMAAIAIFTLIIIPTADARWVNPKGGYCPKGTCGKGGHPYAGNAANCSAAHCRSQQK
jgi:hypothetical protein